MSGNIVGVMKNDLDTPALLVDLDALESNIALMAGRFREAGVAWRPHVKGIKVPAIAHMALAAGAIGVTCAKLGEAEVMAAAGIRDILIASQIVGPSKVARLCGLQRHASVKVLVDDAAHVEILGASARAAGVRIPILIEVDIGMRRAGVEPLDPALRLARQIAEVPSLQLVGVAGWEAQATSIEDQDEKAETIASAVGRLVGTAELLRRNGFPIGIVSCGGTGTYRFTARLPGVTEVQAGGGIFGDVRCRTKFRIDHADSLTVLSTVISRPTPHRIVCDAGKKAMSGDMSMPLPIGLGNVRSISLSAEHATIELDDAKCITAIGAMVEFVVGYADTTVHLHDEIIGIRNGTVEIVWPILGRGKFQ